MELLSSYEIAEIGKYLDWRDINKYLIIFNKKINKLIFWRNFIIFRYPNFKLKASNYVLLDWEIMAKYLYYYDHFPINKRIKYVFKYTWIGDPNYNFIKFLIRSLTDKSVDPSVYMNFAIRYASKNGHYKIRIKDSDYY